MAKTRFERVRRSAVALSAVLVTVGACTERSPSGPDESQLPPQPLTVTLELPWDEFGSDLQVFGGYGGPDEMLATFVAKAYDGMEARTLLRFEPYPRSAQVRDADNTLRTDTALTFIDAYVVVVFDTLASTNTAPVTLALQDMQEDFDVRSATWANAVDTLGGVVPWTLPGGGNATPVSTRDWDPTLPGDSAQLFLDSATIRRWRTRPDSSRGARIDLLTDGHRLKMRGAALRLVATTQIDPDTVLVFDLPTTDVTFLYDPMPTPPADGMRVGGAPSWRTVMDVHLPTTLSGPQELCDAVGCPFAVGPQHVTFAGLRLRGRRPQQAYQPTDSLTFDVRAVLSPSALPKSPVGGSFIPRGGARFGPEPFGVQEGAIVKIPITAFVQTQLAGPDLTGRDPPTTIALLAAPEPESMTFAEFFGPGGLNAPELELILTVSPPLELR